MEELETVLAVITSAFLPCLCGFLAAFQIPFSASFYFPEHSLSACFNFKCSPPASCPIPLSLVALVPSDCPVPNADITGEGIISQVGL